jgi:hypothetical protein
LGFCGSFIGRFLSSLQVDFSDPGKSVGGTHEDAIVGLHDKRVVPVAGADAQAGCPKGVGKLGPIFCRFPCSPDACAHGRDVDALPLTHLVDIARKRLTVCIARVVLDEIA